VIKNPIQKAISEVFMGQEHKVGLQAWKKGKIMPKDFDVHYSQL
jgi:hypothetical protein